VAHAELGPRLEKDLRAARRDGELRRVKDAIEALKREDAGLDIVPLVGRAPWRRLRSGDWRILFRPLEPEEMRHLGRRGRGYLIARAVNRRDLERVARTL
jgi:hypothetical protein